MNTFRPHFPPFGITLESPEKAKTACFERMTLFQKEKENQ